MSAKGSLEKYKPLCSLHVGFIRQMNMPLTSGYLLWHMKGKLKDNITRKARKKL